MFADSQQTDFFLPNDFINSGSLTIDSASGLVQVHGSVLDNDGTLKLGSASGSITVYGTLTNDGTMAVSAPASASLTGPFTLSGGTLDVAGTLYGTGSQSVTAGLLSVEGNWNVASGLALSGGTLLGTGTITGDVTNGATVSPGPLTAPGTLHITGNYTQQSAGTLAVRVAAAGSDLLSVGGAATLAGTLAVNGAGFTPSPGQTFTILSDASQANQFGTVTGQGYTPTYDATDVKLVPTQVTASPTALSYGTSAAPVVLGHTSPAQTTTLTDNGQTAVNVGSVSLSGASRTPSPSPRTAARIGG